MSRPRSDLSDRRFGRLLAMQRMAQPAPGSDGKARWSCRCDCGRVKIVRGAALVSGKTRSCGCILRTRQQEADVTQRRQQAGASGLIRRKSLDQAWRETCETVERMLGPVRARVKWEET